MRRRRFLLAGAMGLAVLAYLAIARFDRGPAVSPTPAAKTSTILRNARAQHSVHYTSNAVMGAAATDYTAGDVGNGRGVLVLRQHYWSSDNKWHWSSLTVVVIGGNTYVRGLGAFADSGLTPGQTRRYAGRWISIPRGSKLHYLAAGGTLDSFLRQITPHGRLKTSVSTVKGRKIIGINGTTPYGQAQISVDASTLLPIGAGYSAGAGAGGTKISRWNEPLHVTAPAHAIPIASVRHGS